MEFRRWDTLPGVGAWLASLREVDPAEWAALYRRMDPARRSRCDRYARRSDARRCILADALARQAVSELCGVDPAAVAFARHPQGKPYAVDLPVEFSLSHSGDLVLCAAALFPVGADLQRRRPLSPALARRMARAGCPGGSEADFFRWWVRQEAAGKLSGQGLSLRPVPPGLSAYAGELEADGARYDYCICAQISC